MLEVLLGLVALAGGVLLMGAAIDGGIELVGWMYGPRAEIGKAGALHGSSERILPRR